MDSKNSAPVRVTTGIKSELGIYTTSASVLIEEVNEQNIQEKEKKTGSVSACASTSNMCSGSSLIQGDESVSKREESINPSSREVDKRRKSSSKNRKVKVDWTPELHRKFVQAVEHIGIEKAVPSKILELMRIDCLTRHNVASHLQKYRTHRRHVVAREAKTASWSWRQQRCGSSGMSMKKDKDAWIVPTTGFPPVSPSPNFRPLQVWGYPSVDQSLVYPLHRAPPSWPPPHPPPQPLSSDPPFWYYHHQDVSAPGMPYLPHIPHTMYPTPPVPGIPPNSMYNTYSSVGVPTQQTLPHRPCDFHPSKESIDTVIGDVLTKPWLPLPLGLKPPSTDSVIVELQSLGISKVPPDLCLTSR